MGRGEKHQQRASTAGLLFGPRRDSKPLDPARKREIAKLKRERAVKLLRSQHQQALRQAEDALLAGDGQPMIDLLNSPAPRGTVANEREFLRDLSQRFHRHFRSPALASAPAMTANLSTIEALQQLRQRATLRRLSAGHQDKLTLALGSNISLLIANDFNERLQRDRQLIGPLPRLWLLNQSPVFHLRRDNSSQTLCGLDLRPRSGSSHPAARGATTPLSYEIGCRDCNQRWASGEPTDNASPEQWFKDWMDDRDSAYASLQFASSDMFSWNGPPADMSADELHQRFFDWRLRQIERIFAAGQHPLPRSLRNS